MKHVKILRTILFACIMAAAVSSFPGSRLFRVDGNAFEGQMFAQAVKAKKEQKAAGALRLTILFFNDLHGNIQSFKVKTENGKSIDTGGIAVISHLVKSIRAENKKKGIQTFLLVAGDVIQGTPLSNVFKGKPDIEIFNAMGVDAMTVGNHEFDFGLDNFLELKKIAKFPFISSNIIWKGAGTLMNDPSASFKLNGTITLTVIGATTKELLTTTAPTNVAKIDILDSVKTASEQYAGAIQTGPVILLSHSRYSTDSEIAKAIPGLTAIIGGHDQILFKPHKIAHGVPVFQA